MWPQALMGVASIMAWSTRHWGKEQAKQQADADHDPDSIARILDEDGMEI